MNIQKRTAITRRYCLPENSLRQAYENVFNHPDARFVLMDLIVSMGAFERSGRQGDSPEYSVGFGDGKKAAVFRILEFSGLEDRMLRTIDPDFTGE